MDIDWTQARNDHFNAKKTQQPTIEPEPAPWSMDDFLAVEDEPLTWTLDGVLIDGGTSLLSAKPKAGKSQFASALGWSVGSGSEFIDRATASGPVLYIAIDQSARITRNRFRVMAGKCPAPRLEVKTTMTNGDPVNRVQWLDDLAEAKKYRLVIIDTLARFRPDLFGDGKGVRSDGGYTAVNRSMDDLRRIAEEHNVHVMALHHDRKGAAGTDDDIADRALGSTALTGAVDTVIGIRRTPDGRLLSTLQREGDDLEETFIDLDEHGFPRLKETKEEARGAQHDSAILSFLDECPNAEHSKVMARIAGKDADIRAALNRLVSMKLIATSGAGKKGDPKRYNRIF